MRAICSSRSQKKVRRTKRNMANRIVKKKCKKMGYLKNVAFLMDLLWLMPPPAYKVTRSSGAVAEGTSARDSWYAASAVSGCVAPSAAL